LKTPETSVIGCQGVHVTALLFHRQARLRISVNGLTAHFFPTLPVAIAHLTSILTSAPEAPEPEPESAETFIQKSVTKTQSHVLVIGSFHRINSSIVLRPIGDNLPIATVEITFNYMSKRVTASLSIPRKIVASMSPALISGLDRFLSTSQLFETREKQIVKLAPAKASTGIEIQLCGSTKEIEVVFACQPKRSDISCIVGIGPIASVVHSVAISANLMVHNVYLKTQNVLTAQTTIGRAARLFEFNVPRIDVFATLNSLQVDIRSIVTSFSGDKIEEISVFNDVWVDPFIKTFASRPRAPVEIEPEEPAVGSPMTLSLRVAPVNLVFRYAAAAGELELTIVPIRAHHSPEFTFLSLARTTLASTGQLSSEFVLESLFAYRVKTGALFDLVRCRSTRLNMKMGDDQVLEFGIGQLHGSHNLIAEMSSAMLSIETPQLRITGLTVPTLRTFIRTVTEPIIVGVARANRSEFDSDDEDLLRKSSLPIPHAVSGKLVFVSNRASVEIFRYHFRDNESVGLVLKAVCLLLDVVQSQTRNLKFKLLPIVLSRQFHETGKTIQPRDILKLPGITGDLDTDQPSLQQRTVTYNFITSFDGPIEPSLNLSDYEMTVATIKYLVANIGLGQKEADSAAAKVKSTRSKKTVPPKQKYTFVPMHYRFDPCFRAGMRASINPNVAWLLQQLGISDEHIIPASLFEFVCLGLETLLSSLSDVLG
jgi:hypothetical protein